MPLPVWLTRPVMYAIGALVAALLVWWLIATLMGGKRAEVQAKLNSNIAGAALESGKDAVNTVGQTAGRADQSDKLTKENSDAIHAAQGADAKVDPATRAAGLVGLCKRAAYRLDPRCVRPAAP